MITAYFTDQTRLKSLVITSENAALLEQAIWVDLLSPTKEEEQLVEQAIKFDIPTPEEMQEIEPSSRLYRENGTLFLTASMLAYSATEMPKNDPVTFILAMEKLITIRYVDLKAFTSFTAHIGKLAGDEFSGVKLFIGLLESTTDRLADILEIVSNQLDQISQVILHSTPVNQPQGLDYKHLLQTIGANGDLGAKARESLLSFNRLMFYYIQAAGKKLDADTYSRIEVITKDLTALSDHASFISTKVNFLLDATLGLVNIEQNNIIKIFSVAAVIFLPPTLIASIYGMNFTVMPELNWKIGYPIAIILMIVSAILPYVYFKRRKWL